ncbi:YfiM family protein, partial [bacterium]|nr:YfiM family protein [bacterium]
MLVRMFAKKIVLLSFVLWASSGCAWAEEILQSKTRTLSPITRTALLTVGINATVATVSYFAFWQGKTEAFHVKNDGWFGQHEYSLGADKVGHVWTAYHLTNFSAWSYRIIGVPEFWAELGGMANAQLALLIMEIGDGMSPWGFSSQDVISNSVGALFAYSRLRWPIMQDLTDFKLTYLLQNTVPLISGEQEPGFFENYDEMTYWL